MNVKYKKYIGYIVKDIELPYLKSLDQYGLKQGEVVMVLSKVYNESVTIKGDYVYDSNDNQIYYETSSGYWRKYEYDNNDDRIYREDSNGFWAKYEYDTNGNIIYYETSNGSWSRREYDANGNVIYVEDSDGVIVDNR